ncbi:MAG TPA: hypothetical protein VMV69_29790 [Pirellulales bacterium]|nr:hypothetical protein [Pirellulales bacterium]
MVAVFAMDRAVTAPLGSTPEIGQAAQVGENLFHRDLLPQGFEIDRMWKTCPLQPVTYNLSYARRNTNRWFNPS